MISGNNTIFDIIIIGSGASGMMAAVSCAYRGHSVLLLEHKDKPGKKILATGNGRCNLTNRILNASHYHGEPALIESVLSSFSVEDTLTFFRQLGVPAKDKNGYYYPRSEQAASVVMAFENELGRLGVRLLTGEAPTSIRRKADLFQIRTENNAYSGKKLILCCGGRADPKLGSDGSLFPVIERLGHHFTPLMPGLCGFYAEGLPFKKLGGVRREARITLYHKDKPIATDLGELQFTEYGISGIPVFQISHDAGALIAGSQKARVSLDLFPDMTEEELLEELNYRRAHFSRETAAWLLNGLLPAKLIPAVLEKAGIVMEKKIHKLSEADITALCSCLKTLWMELTSSKGFENAQVTCGGIRTSELDMDTLESKIVAGLYFAGEILDVDGICGGYNLQWAWSSGYKAAQSACKDL